MIKVRCEINKKKEKKEEKKLCQVSHNWLILQILNLASIVIVDVPQGFSLKPVLFPNFFEHSLPPIAMGMLILTKSIC